MFLSSELLKDNAYLCPFTQRAPLMHSPFLITVVMIKVKFNVNIIVDSNTKESDKHKKGSSNSLIYH